jgi:hypothetical protein
MEGGGEGVNATPWPFNLRERVQVSTVQRVQRPPGPVGTGAENIVPIGIWCPDRPALASRYTDWPIRAHQDDMHERAIACLWLESNTVNAIIQRVAGAIYKPETYTQEIKTSLRGNKQVQSVRAACVKRRVRPSGGIASTSKTDVRLTFESLFFRRGRLFEEAVNKLSGRQGAGRSGATPASQSNIQCTRSDTSYSSTLQSFEKLTTAQLLKKVCFQRKRRFITESKGSFTWDMSWARLG